MIMKQLFRHTSTLLRSALLLGAMAFVNIQQTQGQTAAQLAEMPNAFETIENPNTIIGNGQYYYIQFYHDDKISYLTDCGLSKKAGTKDFLPSNNRLWTMERVGDSNQFKLKSKTGYYIGLAKFEGASGNRYGSVASADDAVTFEFQSNSTYGYSILDTQNHYFNGIEDRGLGLLGRYNNQEWNTDLSILQNDNTGKGNSQMHIAQLKSNVAYIIYYRQEEKNEPVDAKQGNTNPNAETTRHYLTYSNTGNETDARSNYDSWLWKDSKVSSRKSIIPKDKLLRTLPTLAAYHQDGLWTIEDAGTNGEFYIKKYGTEEYLNGVKKNSDFYISDLGTKDETYGKYSFEDANANRYTRVMIKDVATSSLADGQFYQWNYNTSDPTASTQNGSANAESHYNESLGPKGLVIGWGNVLYNVYADLTGCTKMVIEGTRGMQLRVLLNRLEVGNGGGDENGGAIIERNPVIGDDGKAELDLTDLPYVHLNAIKTGWSSSGTVSSITLVRPDNSSSRHLNSAHGDGWYALQWGADDGDDWYAGFYPVEVPDTKKDEYYGVLLKVKPRKDNRIKLTRESNSQGNPDIQPLAGSTLENLYGAKFTPDKAYTNLFQIKNLPIGCYESLVIEFEGGISSGWGISGIIGGEQKWETMQAGITKYTMSLNGFSSINDFTIFNVGEPNGSITIKACYFTPSEEPDCGKNEMLIHNGGTANYSEEQGVRKLWKLEQIDPYDYSHFRLETPEGGYYRADGVVTDNAENAKIFTNTELLERFDLKWFYIEPAVKEIPVDKMITHKVSYLKQYAKPGLDKQGLATDADSDWWDNDKGTQKTNHFEITHYVRKDRTLTVEYPTELNYNNDHIYYQRFYHYNDETCDAAYPDGTDIDGLKNHVSLDVDGNVQYFLYKNGMVTGEKLKWDALDQGSYERKAQRRFKFTNSDGKNFTVAVDVSRYSDLTYESTDPLTSNLEEPSLTMRYIYYMRDAKVMAKNLTGYPEQAGVTNKTAWKEEGSVCTDQYKWMERKTIHFPAKPLPYENDKWAGYRGEFIGLRHVFSDYWVFADGDVNSTDDGNLVSAVTDNNGGKIEVKIYDPNNTGIRLGGWNPVLADNPGLKQNTTEGNDEDYQGFYFYDKVARNLKTQYGDSRFVVFRYPKDSDGKATAVTNTGKEAFIHVYLNNNGTRYQLAQFTIIFDKDTETIPWTSVNNSAQVKGSSREPKQLYDIAGDPIAKVTFDYPSGDTYHYPDKGVSRHDGGGDRPAGSTIANSSPIPLSFGHTNYAFDGNGANWGSYAMVSEKRTTWGNDKHILPADDGTPVSEGSTETYGYNRSADTGMQKAFLYIDASEQPGDICAIDFQGEFCEQDQLMCSGWISGSNRYSDNGEYRCPGGITLTVKGEDSDGSTIPIYRFCPGQCYELDNGTGTDGSTDANHVVWQQFYFTFNTDKKYERYWLEVNNNCVSSNGGDFMLDNIEVYTIVPTVDSEINTPLCVKKDGTTEMRLLKLDVDYNRLKSSAPESSGDTPYLGFVFLDKMKFLTTFKSKMGLPEDLSLEQLADDIEKGKYDNIQGNDQKYKDAFDAALLGTKNIWKSTDSNLGANKGAGVMYFQWNKNFESIPQYSFYKAVNKQGATFRGTNKDGDPILILNGNYPELPWRTNVDYYIVPSNAFYDTFGDDIYSAFNICSACTKTDELKLDPPYTVLGLEKSKGTDDYVVCEGQIPTVALNLKGYDLNGKQVPMTGLNFDWWLGDKANGVLATLDNYHSQQKYGVKLDNALSTMRAYYPDATNLDGIVQNLSKTPNLTLEMTIYLQELIDKGQLILHQTSVSVPAESSSAEDPYFYLVACPIHDANFSQALNPRPGTDYVAFFCDEPQGLRIKLGEKAPKLKSGFVKGENGYDDEYNYAFPEGTDPVLSIRLAKMAQFEQVRHGETTDNPVETYNESAPNTEHFLWLPIRNAEVESSSATGVVRKSRATIEESDDYNVYLASSDDPTWDKAIYKSMSGNNPSLPVVGKIVKLNAVDTKGKTNVDQTSNRLCIYFTTNFDVREGYSYTLSLPFKENAGDNACDGTILINLKIVPDYEVWTGAAGNTDWNNDQNWRRADGNLATSTTESTDGSARNNNELLVSSDLSASSPLKDYTTNYANYRTAKDRIFRKGFAPLYCTHVLIKSNEWGNAPVLYDAIDGAGAFSAKPFPNLRDKDNWDSKGAEATATPILKFDMQAREHSLWPETYGKASNKGRDGDLIAEMYQINSCDEIAFQPGAELLNAHLLNYNSAWVEYQLDTKRWYLLGSPLQGTISGEWYAPTGTAQQKTTYYEPVTFGAGYDRYSPAIYQRSWDKAKAVLYEVGSAYDKDDDKQDANLGNDDEGMWNNAGTTDAPVWQWQSDGTADQYLDRLGYKPMHGKKANVAIKGLWSNTYNDAQVDYATGGFSVMVMNHLKGKTADVQAIVRLPKEDTFYDYYGFDRKGGDNVDQFDDIGTNTQLSDVRSKNRALNRGRLKTDLLLPTSAQKQEKEATTYRYGDRRMLTRIPINESKLSTMINGIRPLTETVPAGVSNLGYYLVENPFPCGLDMNAFFAANTGLQKKYWILTKGNDSNPRQQLVQQAPSSEWVSPGTGETNFSVSDAVVAPGQGFFVQATTAGEGTAIIFNKDMQAQTRYGSKDQGTNVTIEVGREPVMVEKEFQVDEDGDGTPETTITESVPDYEADGVTPKTKPITQDVIVYTYVQDTGDGKVFPLKTRGEGVEAIQPGLVITAQRDDSETSALVMQRGGASNDFLPEEDTEVFINSDFENAPTVYTLCGRLATTINSIHDFRSLPIGVESTSDAPCTLTFRSVEMLGDSISFYDAVEQKLTPLESGMSFKVSGQTQNRYYLVRSLNLKDAAEETHLQIFTEGLKAKVIASTAEPITVVRCFDTAGRLICTASPQLPEYSFDLPRAGVYIIEAETEHDRKTRKVIVK